MVVKMVMGKVYSIINRQKGVSSQKIKKIEIDRAELRVSILYEGDEGVGYSEISVGQKKLKESLTLEKRI